MTFVSSRPFRALESRRRRAFQGPAQDATWITHIRELRVRIVICAAGFLAASVVGFFAWNTLLSISTEPYCAAQRAVQQHTEVIRSCALYISDPLELFTTRLTVAAYLGLLFVSPLFFWHAWRFVVPGLSQKERSFAFAFTCVATTLFVTGALLAWQLVPRALHFLFSFTGPFVATLLNPAAYLRFLASLMLVFGLAFETPLVLVSLQLAHVVTSQQLRSWRRQAIVANFALAAVVTPSQDPLSMMALALPLCALYELAIVCGRCFRK